MDCLKTVLSEADEQLMNTFYDMLLHGMHLQLHKGGRGNKGVKKKIIKLSLCGSELRWQIKGILSNVNITTAILLS